MIGGSFFVLSRGMALDGALSPSASLSCGMPDGLLHLNINVEKMRNKVLDGTDENQGFLKTKVPHSSAALCFALFHFFL
jgi:hypothetical protein